MQKHLVLIGDIINPRLALVNQDAWAKLDAKAHEAMQTALAKQAALHDAAVVKQERDLLFLLTCNVLLLLVGCFMETLAAILILVTILVSAAQVFGIDPAQFAIMMILNLVLGTIHPAVGVVLLISSRIAEISYETLARAVLPWLIPLFCVLAAITLLPPLTTWLPYVVMGR